ncbi:hypothetical protein [Rhizobium leguminosarum]
MTSERETVSSNQKTTGTRGFLTGCFAYADDEVSGKLVFSGVREGFRLGGLEHFRFSPSHGTLYLFVFCAIPDANRRALLLELHQSMSRKSVQRFCDNDMRKIKDLKREERI